MAARRGRGALTALSLAAVLLAATCFSLVAARRERRNVVLPSNPADDDKAGLTYQIQQQLKSIRELQDSINMKQQPPAPAGFASDTSRHFDLVGNLGDDVSYIRAEVDQIQTRKDLAAEKTADILKKVRAAEAESETAEDEAKLAAKRNAKNKAEMLYKQETKLHRKAEEQDHKLAMRVKKEHEKMEEELHKTHEKALSRLKALTRKKRRERHAKENADKRKAHQTMLKETATKNKEATQQLKDEEKNFKKQMQQRKHEHLRRLKERDSKRRTKEKNHKSHERAEKRLRNATREKKWKARVASDRENDMKFDQRRIERGTKRLAKRRERAEKRQAAHQAEVSKTNAQAAKLRAVLQAQASARKDYEAKLEQLLKEQTKKALAVENKISSRNKRTESEVSDMETRMNSDRTRAERLEFAVKAEQNRQETARSVTHQSNQRKHQEQLYKLQMSKIPGAKALDITKPSAQFTAEEARTSSEIAETVSQALGTDKKGKTKKDQDEDTSVDFSASAE